MNIIGNIKNNVLSLFCAFLLLGCSVQTSQNLIISLPNNTEEVKLALSVHERCNSKNALLKVKESVNYHVSPSTCPVPLIIHNGSHPKEFLHIFHPYYNFSNLYTDNFLKEYRPKYDFRTLFESDFKQTYQLSKIDLHELLEKHANYLKNHYFKIIKNQGTHLSDATLQFIEKLREYAISNINSIDDDALKNIPKHLKNSKIDWLRNWDHFIIEASAVAGNTYTFQSVDINQLKLNKEKYYYLQYINRKAFKQLSIELQHDHEVVLNTIQKRMYPYEYYKDLPVNLRGNIEIAKAAAKFLYSFNLKWVPKRLRENRAYILFVARNAWVPVLEFFPDKFKNDEEIMLAAVNKWGKNFKWASIELKQNKELILTAISHPEDPISLLYVADKFKDDKDIVIAAIKRDGQNLKWVSNRLNRDREVVLTAIKNSKELGSIQMVIEKFKDDKEIVLAAVKRNGHELKWASNRLRLDRETVLAATKYSKSTVMYMERIPEKFRHDKDIILPVLIRNPYDFESLPEHLKRDEEFILKIIPELSFKRFNFDYHSLNQLREILSNISNDLYKNNKFTKRLAVILIALYKNSFNPNHKLAVEEMATVFSKYAWSRKEFVLAISDYWFSLKSCFFYANVPESLKNVEFKKELHNINSYCKK